MGFRERLMELRGKIIRFMYGRNGFDKLANAIFVLYFVVVVINMIARLPLLDMVGIFLVVYMCFRVFSKNIYKRRAENDKFLKIWSKVKADSKLFIVRIKEIKTHRYRKCSYCKATLRLPRKTGNHKVICPHCKREINVNILF